MTFFQLATGESKREWGVITGAFAVSGVAVTGVLAVVNTSAHHVGRLRFDLLALFVLGILLFIVSFRYAVRGLTGLVESALYRVRLRLCEKLRRAELYRIEQLGLTEIYSRVTQQTTEISNSTWSLAIGTHSAVSIACTTLYVGYLSPVVLAIMAIASIIVVPMFLRRRQQAQAFMAKAAAQETGLFNVLTDLLRGFKESHLRARRGQELLEEFRDRASELQGRTLQIHLINQGNYVFVTLAIFLLLAVNVFVLPQYMSTSLYALNVLTSSILFLLNPVGHVINAYPEYERANLAAAHLAELERQLDEASAPARPAKSDPWHGHFAELRATGLRFEHTGAASDRGFAVGPVDFTIQAGEIIFFVGGNGSGKTTLLKLLSALYTPSEGGLLVDGVPVGPLNAQAYREMIAAIFTDFHLFQKLYGLSGVSAGEVDRALQEMQIADRTSFMGGRFKTLDLSTGQRKRLAMVVALLEDRPLYIFDEWAADQDPEFRRYYYEVLLQGLKARGKTVLAISHDDRYFHCADRVITMESGTIRSITCPSGDLIS